MTTVRKGVRGTWEAEDSIDLVALRVLKIHTHKVSGGQLVTTATVHTKDNGFLSHMMYADFSHAITVSKDRCTEGNVTAQHAAAMAGINQIHSAITAHYVKKDEAVAV